MIRALQRPVAGSLALDAGKAVRTDIAEGAQFTVEILHHDAVRAELRGDEILMVFQVFGKADAQPGRREHARHLLSQHVLAPVMIRRDQAEQFGMRQLHHASSTTLGAGIGPAVSLSALHDQPTPKPISTSCRGRSKTSDNLSAMVSGIEADEVLP